VGTTHVSETLLTKNVTVLKLILFPPSEKRRRGPIMMDPLKRAILNPWISFPEDGSRARSICTELLRKQMN
jgi:hypothetical protein